MAFVALHYWHLIWGGCLLLTSQLDLVKNNAASGPVHCMIFVVPWKGVPSVTHVKSQLLFPLPIPYQSFYVNVSSTLIIFNKHQILILWENISDLEGFLRCKVALNCVFASSMLFYFFLKEGEKKIKNKQNNNKNK